MSVKFYSISSIADSKLAYAVIVSRYENQWVYCRHKMRDTWEAPGGHREAEEDIMDTARRELYEETGAELFSIEPVCVYGVVREEISYGLLCYAIINKMGPLPNWEIGEIQLFDKMPSALTYPDIQPMLMEKIRVWLEGDLRAGQ